MDVNKYKGKLEQFNKTANYRSEYELLRGLIGVDSKTVVDYGCGTGFLVDKFDNDSVTIVGYDVNDYWDNQYPSYLRAKSLPMNFNTVYFMHSLSHIENLQEVLRNLYTKISGDGRIIVITPNPDWIRLFNERFKREYKPDPTVVKHLDREELFQVMNDSGFLEITCGQVGMSCDGQHERLFGVYQRKSL
jgi:2-polyprenyl-3-methyl-5-hydroxy-6-metoxy-1,4-benzoquinol methylase